jgi:Zn-dependent protease with chaperone function
MTEGLIERFSEKEIETIIYHELGHIKLRHGKLILVLIFVVALAVSVLMFYIRQIMLAFGWWQYLLVFPIGVIVLVIISEWFPKKISKAFEHQADAFVIKNTKEKELYINTLIKLAEYNDEFYSDSVKRSDWNDTHPSLKKRIDYLERNF